MMTHRDEAMTARIDIIEAFTKHEYKVEQVGTVNVPYDFDVSKDLYHFLIYARLRNTRKPQYRVMARAKFGDGKHDYGHLVSTIHWIQGSKTWDTRFTKFLAKAEAKYLTLRDEYLSKAKAIEDYKEHLKSIERDIRAHFDIASFTNVQLVLKTPKWDFAGWQKSNIEWRIKNQRTEDFKILFINPDTKEVVGTLYGSWYVLEQYAVFDRLLSATAAGLSGMDGIDIVHAGEILRISVGRDDLLS